MSIYGKNDQSGDAPNFVTNASTGQKGPAEYGTKVFGVSEDEARVSKIPPGWTRIVTGTGGRAGRKLVESLAPFRRIVGDGSDDSTLPDAAAPTNSQVPTIAGTAEVGQTLTATEGTWAGTPTPVVTGQWKRTGVAIAGATNLTYVLVADDLGETITYVETATNFKGTQTATSTATAEVV